MKTAGGKEETERLIIAAQDQRLPTRNYRENIKTDQTKYIEYVWIKTESIDLFEFGWPNTNRKVW